MRSTWIALLIGLLASASTAESTDPVSGITAPPSQGEAVTSIDPSSGEIRGSVTQTMDAGRYTYVELDTGAGRIWAAGPKTAVKVGDTVFLANATPMADFFSNYLNRSFDLLYLVPAIGMAPGAGASPHPPLGARAGGTEAPEAVVSGIERASGGQTVAEIIAGRADLSGSDVTLRGKVVKVNSRILGKNWIHLQDGTVGPGGEDKVIATTDAAVDVGSTVVVRGTLSTDKDYGYGYKYDVLIEDASVAAE